MVAKIVPSELRERQRMPQENKMVAQEVPKETQGPFGRSKGHPRRAQWAPKRKLGGAKMQYT